MNPFIFEKIAQPDEFCGRKNEAAQLLQLICDQKNICLYSERRYGKSTLIHFIFSELPDEIIPVYLDIYDIVEPQDFAIALYSAIGSALPFDFQRSFKELSRMFKKVKFDITGNVDGLGFVPKVAGRTFEELVEDALAGLNSFCQKNNKKAVIAIDEFQEISRIKSKRIDALLRKYMQKTPDLSFIFSGSKKHLLTGLFLERNAPLYNMATSMHLTGIDEELLFLYCNERLKGRLNVSMFKRLYEEARGQTKLILQVCYHFYYLEEKKLDDDQLDFVLMRIVNEVDEQFRMYFDRIPAQQRKAIKMLAKTNGVGLYGKIMMSDYDTNKSQLQKAIQSLSLSEEIDKNADGYYYITDVLFSLWCKAKFS